jgi:hypothetical protein
MHGNARKPQIQQAIVMQSCSVSLCTCAGSENPMGHNRNQPPGGMYHVNIFLHPFNFTKPEYFIREGGGQQDGKTLGLWKLPALGLGDGRYFNIPEETWTKAASEIIQVNEMPS